MTIGPDIKEAIQEIGPAITIVRDSGNVTGEYIITKGNAQVTKPFIREFFLEAKFQYDSEAVAGDFIEIDTTGDRYIIMNFTPLLFEDTVFEYDSVLYKTNVTATIYRPSETRENYRTRTVWSTVKSGIKLLLTTPLHGHDLETDEQLGLLGIENHELYIPSSIGIQPLDRVWLSTGEYFRVETIKKRRYEDVDVCGLGEDTRVWTTTTTTTTTTTSSSSSTTTTTA